MAPGACPGINAADDRGRPLRWLLGTGPGVPAGGTYVYETKSRVIFSVRVSDDKSQLFSPECTGTSEAGTQRACCYCRGMWQATPRVPFYAHVVKCLQNGVWDYKYYTLNTGRRKSVCMSRRDSNVHLSETVRILKSRWGSIRPGLQTVLCDTVKNIGREGKQRHGSRWSSSLLLHHSKKLLLRCGSKVLREWGLNCCPLPSRRKAKQCMSRVSTWGVQSDQLAAISQTSASNVFPISDNGFRVATVSVDDLSLTQRFDTIYDPVQKVNVLVGHANACATVKYGAGQTFPITDKASMPSAKDVPVAKYAGLWIAHTHVRKSPVYGVLVQPHDGLCFVDYLLNFNLLEVTGQSVGVVIGALGCDNVTVQLLFQQALTRPWLDIEFRYLRQRVDELGDGDIKDDDILTIASSLSRTCGQVKYFITELAKSSAADLVNMVCVPYRGYPVNANPSAYSDGVAQTISAEYRHSSRLFAKVLRDKCSKLIQWSFLLGASPALFLDIVTLYYSLNQDVHGLHYNTIDVSDSTQSQDRAVELSSWHLIPLLLNHFGHASSGAHSTCIHILVSGAYLRVFWDPACDPPISSLARACLGMFCATAMTAQRVEVLKRKHYSLKVNSYSAPLYNSIIMHVGGLMCLKMLKMEQTLVPQELGEWKNETCFGLVRDPNGMRSANVSAKEFLERCGPVFDVAQYELSSLEYQNVASDKQKRAHSEHPNSHPSYNDRPTLLCMYAAMHVGFTCWKKLALALGYTIPKQYSFQSLYCEFLRRTKPGFSDVVSWKDMVDGLQTTPEWIVDIEKQCDATTLLQMEQQLSGELSEFFKMVDLIVTSVVADKTANSDNEDSSNGELGDSVDSDGGCDPTDVVDRDVVDRDAFMHGDDSCFDGADSVDVGGMPVVIQNDEVQTRTGKRSLLSANAGRHLVCSLNRGLRKQSRNLLERYAQPNLRVMPDGNTSNISPHDFLVLGESYLMVFEPKDLYIGCVRSIYSAVVKAGKRPYSAVPLQDSNAYYFCDSYLKVDMTDDGKGILLTLDHEIPKYYRLAMPATASDEVFDDDDDDMSEYEDDDCMETGESSTRKHTHSQLVSNVKFHVPVDWDKKVVTSSECTTRIVTLMKSLGLDQRKGVKSGVRKGKGAVGRDKAAGDKKKKGA